MNYNKKKSQVFSLKRNGNLIADEKRFYDYYTNLYKK